MIDKRSYKGDDSFGHKAGGDGFQGIDYIEQNAAEISSLMQKNRQSLYKLEQIDNYDNDGYYDRSNYDDQIKETINSVLLDNMSKLLMKDEQRNNMQNSPPSAQEVKPKNKKKKPLTD